MVLFDKFLQRNLATFWIYLHLESYSQSLKQAIFTQNQVQGLVWEPQTKTNLPKSIENASLILNALKSYLNKKSEFIDSLL